MTEAVDGSPVDGRTARSQRTRDAIVDACITLVDGGDYRPTAPRIAAEAGVSVRSVFQHFDDLESLYTAVAERAVERVSRLLVPVEPDLDFDTRLERFVRQRSQLFEAVADLRRAAMTQEPSSETIGRWLDLAATFLRAEVEYTFRDELDGTDPMAETRLDAVDLALGWASWETLRHRSKLDVETAAAVVRFTAERLLQPRRQAQKMAANG